jgi:type II secretory pathway component PulF
VLDVASEGRRSLAARAHHPGIGADASAPGSGRPVPQLLGPKSQDDPVSRQFTLVDSGGAHRGPELLGSQISNRSLAGAVSQLQDDVRIGTSLSNAVAKASAGIPEMYCG